MTIHRILTGTAAFGIGLLAALAVLNLPGMALLDVLMAAPPLGVVVFAIALHRAGDSSPGSVRGCRATAVAVSGIAVMAVLASGGLVVLFGAASPPILVLVGLSVVGWAWWRRPPARLVGSTASARTGQDPPQPPAALPARDWRAGDVRALATDALCWQWRRSYGTLRRATDPHVAHQIVAWRQACLDELHHRDPDGVRRWLATGARAGSDPTRFLTTAATPRRTDELDGQP